MDYDSDGRPMKRRVYRRVEVDADTVYLTCAQLREVAAMDVTRIKQRNVTLLDSGMGSQNDKDAHAMVGKCLKELRRREVSDLKAQRTELSRQIRKLGAR